MEPVLTRGPWKSWKSPFLVTCAQVQFLTQSLGPGTCTLTHMLCPHTHTHMHVSHMHVFTCMLMPSHVCMHVQCTGACIHKSTCGHTIHTCMDMCTCKHVYMYTYAHMHAHVNMYKLSNTRCIYLCNMRVDTHASACTDVGAYTQCACMQTTSTHVHCVHTHAHTHILCGHTYTRLHVHTPSPEDTLQMHEVVVSSEGG